MQHLQEEAVITSDRIYNRPPDEHGIKKNIKMTSSRLNALAEELKTRAAANLYRRRRTVESAQGRMLLIDGRQLINFCSNDYLGLAGDERVRNAFAAGVRDWGAGAGAAHLVCGHTRAHDTLEQALAEFTGCERCLLFSSGYAANMGTLNALAGRGDFIFADRLNHASLIDGALLSGARIRRYAHRDLDALAKQLIAADEESRKLIVSDGTFSMDGTVCDVDGLLNAARTHDAWLMLDEAHSLGVTGTAGRGLTAEVDAEDALILIGTLGKAFGTQGGFVAGSEDLIETLIQTARTYIYSTALPAAVAVATQESLAIAQAEQWRRDKLTELVARFKAGAQQAGLKLIDSETPIQPVLLNDEASALAASAALEDRGILVTAIRPPTVPRGTSRLRVTVTAAHTKADIDTLVEALEAVCI